MRYTYNCGQLGGILVHREFRRESIGRRLLEKAVKWLNTSYIYAFVEPENTAAIVI